jgi:H+/Cl- antiporter ClcA
MSLSRERRIVTLRKQLKEPLKLNPFVFSRLFFLWLLIGLIGGVIAGIYWIVLEHLTHSLVLFQGIYVIPVMALAGLFAGLIIHYIGDPGEIQLIVNNIRFKGGRLDPKNNPSMLLSSLLCIASGGSLGPEAPLVQVTGSTGSWMARKLKFKGEDVRSLSIAGMASGFTALFGAPLGGSLFSLEILHHKYVVEYYQALIPAFVASCASYVIFIVITQLGIGPIWAFPAYSSEGVMDFFYAILYGGVAASFGWLFIALVKILKQLIGNWKTPIYIKMCAGGIILGIISFYYPLTRYFGHHEINILLENTLTLQVLVAILLFKILAIAVTVTSGWRGGFIIPLFFVGTTLGLIIHGLYPGQNLALVAVCCMAAINSCVTRTPISTIILLSTLTGFAYFVPIMFASLTGFFLAPKTPFIGAQLDQED